MPEQSPEQIQQLIKLLEELTGKTVEQTKAMEFMNAVSGIAGKNMVKVHSELDKIIQSNIKNMSSVESSAKDIIGVYKNIEKQIDNYEKALKKQGKTEDEINEILKNRKSIKQELVRRAAPSISYQVQDIEKGRIGGAKRAIGGIFNMKSGIGATMEAGASFTKYAEAAKVAAGSTSLVVSGIKALSTAFKALGKGNILFLIIGAVKGLINVVNDLDKFIKGINKTWQTMAGSTVMMGDVTRNMRNFTDAVYTLNRNIQLGLKAEDIMKLFGATSGAGLSLGGLAQRAGDYGTVIEQAREIQLQFGMTLQDTGSAMANQMLNLQASITDVRDAFDAMSYDAAIAGIQSQKFYQIIESANSSLAFYGNFLKSASAEMRELTKAGTMGFKDAAEHATNMLQLFKGMGMTQRMGFINIVGKGNIQKAFSELTSEAAADKKKAEDNVKKLKAALEKATLDADTVKIEKLKKQLAAARKEYQVADVKARRAKRIEESGDIRQMAAYLPMLAKDTGGLVLKALKTLNVDPVTKPLEAITIMTNTFGMSLEDATKLMDRVANSITKAEAIAEDMGGAFDRMRKENKSTFDDMADAIEAFHDPLDKSVTTYEEMISKLKAHLSLTNLTDKQQEQFLEFVANSGKAAAEVARKGFGGVQNLADLILKDVGAPKPEVTKKMQEKQMKELVRQTTTLADFIGIGKENVKYALAASSPQQAMSMAAIATAQNTSNLLSKFSGFLRLWRPNYANKEKEFEATTGQLLKKSYEQELTLRKRAEALYKTGDEKYKIEADILERQANELATTINSIESEFGQFADVITKLKGQAYQEADARASNIDSLNAESEDIKRRQKILNETTEIYAKNHFELLKKLAEEKDPGKRADIMKDIMNNAEAMKNQKVELDALSTKLVEAENNLSGLNKEVSALTDNISTEGMGDVIKGDFRKIADEVLTGVPAGLKEKNEFLSPDNRRQNIKGLLSDSNYKNYIDAMSDKDLLKLVRTIESKWIYRNQQNMFNRGFVTPDNYRKDESKPVNDYKPLKDSLVNVSRGDYVIHEKAFDAAGVDKTKGGLAGDFMHNMLPDFIRGINSKGGLGKAETNVSNNWGGINLNFNAPTGGSPMNYARMFKQAVEQIVDRKMYEDKQRV